MYEYAVPENFHIQITRDPARLFTLAISLLGDLSVLINSENPNNFEIEELQKYLSFSARFFDSYFQAKFDNEINPYLWLLGSAAYYLSRLPGSSMLLAKNIEGKEIDLGCIGLEKLLLWILLGEYKETKIYDDTIINIIIQEIIEGYRHFFSKGSGEEKLFQAIQRLRKIIYESGTPRQLLFVDIIGAITKKKYENSTWYSLPRYTDLSLDNWRVILEKQSFSIKELWPAQHLLGQQGVFKGKSAIIQMPTSAGKTKATEIIIRSAFLSDRTSLAIIVAPFRALCHEIKNNLFQVFKAEQVYVNELSDILQIDFEILRFLGRKQILVVTPEKLNYVLRHSPTLGENIGLIIYDEGHQFDNGIRGVTYELLLTSLKEKLPKNVQSVLLSAVISNGEQIGMWLNGEESINITSSALLPTYRNIAFVSWSDYLGRLYFVNPNDIDVEDFFVPRVIEQYQLQKKNRERIDREFPNKSDGKEIALYLGLKIAKNGSVAIFCGTKRTVISICKKIVDIFSRSIPMQAPYEYSNRVEINKLIFLNEANLGTNAVTTLCARSGIFAHHNNIPHGLRISIEYAVKEGMIKFVICTSTLAQGVNLPLRYLIVTSTYQGEEQIKIRDFQNLIGRSGRAKFHTEGSILFSDPEVYDTHTIVGEQWRWRKVRDLLNPSQSEPCDSTLLSVLKPIELNKFGNLIIIDIEEIIKLYPQGSQAIKDYIKEYVIRFRYNDVVQGELLRQIYRRLEIFSNIESYLMSHCDDDNPGLEEQKVKDLAKGTLAYFLANDYKKIQIEELFILLAKNIMVKIPEPQKRRIFGRTLLGLDNSIQISNWLLANISELSSCNNELELLNLLWPILIDNIHNSIIMKCNNQEIIKKIMFEWLKGKTYSDLYTIVQESGAKIITPSQQRNFQLDNIVEICDNSFSYEGALIVSAIIDLLELISLDDGIQLQYNLQILQQRIRYGLNSQMEILLYELGFSDRVVSMELSSIFQDVEPDKERVLRLLEIRWKQDQIFEILNKYPSYFSEVYRNLI